MSCLAHLCALEEISAHRPLRLISDNNISGSLPGPWIMQLLQGLRKLLLTTCVHQLTASQERQQQRGQESGVSILEKIASMKYAKLKKKRNISSTTMTESRERPDSTGESQLLTVYTRELKSKWEKQEQRAHGVESQIAQVWRQRRTMRRGSTLRSCLMTSHSIKR